MRVKQQSAAALILMSVVAMLLILSGGCQKSEPPAQVTLRSESVSLSPDDMMQVVKDKGFHCPGDNVKGSFKNAFEQVTLGDVAVVIDHSTGLMWQQAEDVSHFSWEEAEAHVVKMNEENLAGFSDWRIPTAEELLSLMTVSKKGDHYIEKIFQQGPLSTWTVDVIPEAFAGAWFVDFNEGKAGDGNRAAGLGHVRLVRTYESAE
jgi:hypothetical protein